VGPLALAATGAWATAWLSVGFQRGFALAFAGIGATCREKRHASLAELRLDIGASFVQFCEHLRGVMAGAAETLRVGPSKGSGDR
jgi:hypothetical protein